MPSNRILNRIRLTSLVAWIGGCLLTQPLASAQDLGASPAPTRFRGEDGLGVYPQCRVKVPWTSEQVTKLDLPGLGNGSPVLWKDTAYLMVADPQTAARKVVAVDWKQAKIAWQRTYESAPHKLHAFSTYASTTPCVDADGVYVAWGEPEHVMIKSLTHDGKERWSRDFGRYVSQHGFGTSPMLVDGLVIVLDSQDAEELEPGVEPGQDRMLALSASTGETVWETPLPTKRVCYGLPSVRTLADGRKELVCATTALGIFGMDAKTGQVTWKHDCFKQRVCASTLLVGPLAIASHGSGGGRDNLLVAYDLDTKSERFRIQRSAPYVPTPVATGDLLFLWSDAGIVSCVRLSDGSVRWSERIGGNFFSSPVLLGDRLVNTSDTGTVTVLSASEGFRELASQPNEAVIRSTIVATETAILLRTDEQLWIIR